MLINFSTIGVIGAGVIGCGVAQQLAEAGFEVVLIDNSSRALEAARTSIKNGMRSQRMLSKLTEKSPIDKILQRIHYQTDLEVLKNVHFVIENVTENPQIKRDIYKALQLVCPEDCLFAANTSAVPITRIASFTNCPTRVIGVHFMNPVPMKPSVEVVCGFHTSNQTVEITKEVLARMGKSCIIIKDSPGFVSNRILMLTINEAICVLHEGVASVSQVDEIFRTCFGHPMGPLETADLIGLDTVLNSLEVLANSLGDNKYRPSLLLRKLVDAGLLGRKSGRGFYDYKAEI